MNRLISFLSMCAIGLVAFTATAFAAGAVAPDDGSLLDLARPVYDAVMHGNYWMAASLALVLLVAGFRRYAPAGKAQYFAHSDAGGALLVLVGAFGSALATGMLAVGTSAVTAALAWTALKIAASAAGGYSLLKPLLAWLTPKMPAWMQPFLSMAGWLFRKPDPIAEAEKAGDQAVKDNPPTGGNGPAGTPTDL